MPKATPYLNDQLYHLEPHFEGEFQTGVRGMHTLLPHDALEFTGARS